MKKSFFKFSLLAAFLFCMAGDLHNASYAQPDYTGRMPVSGSINIHRDYTGRMPVSGSTNSQRDNTGSMKLPGLRPVQPAQEQLKEKVAQNPQDTRSTVRLVLNLISNHQWLSAKTYFSSMMTEMHLRYHDSLPAAEFKQLYGITRHELKALENRFNLVGEQKLKIIEDKMAKGEKFDYSRLHEALVLYPNATETKGDLIKMAIVHYEEKSQSSFFDDQPRTDHFKWNHDNMLKLMHLYHLYGVNDRAAEIAMRALDYARNPEEERYINHIFAMASNVTRISP